MFMMFSLKINYLLGWEVFTVVLCIWCTIPYFGLGLGIVYARVVFVNSEIHLCKMLSNNKIALNIAKFQ